MGIMAQWRAENCNNSAKIVMVGSSAICETSHEGHQNPDMGDKDDDDWCYMATFVNMEG